MLFALPFQRLPPAPRHRRVLVLLFAVLLTACGGGGGNGGGDGSSAAETATRVEIVQTGLLLAGRGDSRALQARVFNAAGERLDLPVTWSSSDPSDIAIGSDGIARAERAIGSSQIVASVGDIRSAPLLGVVTTVAEGTVLVDDAQILRGAVETDSEAEPSLDSTYTVVVSGIAAPAAGTLMVGTGSQPLAGRVVSTREVAGGIEITLKLAPLPELFPQLEINQVFDLSQAPVEIPEEIAADYLVTRDGNTFSFTPRETTAKAVGAAAGTSTLAKGCVATIPNFREGSPLPISIPVAPALRITVNPSLDILYTQSRGLERLLIKAAPVAAFEGGLNVVASFEGKIECKADLFVFRVPIGGALSFILSGLVPVGVSLEAGGKITVATMGISFKNETRFNARIGMECAGDCDFIGEVTDFTNVSTPKLDLPGIGDLRVEPSLLASATVSASLGNPFLKSLRFSSFEAKAGPRLLGSFAPQITQITDTTYKSNYKFAAEFKAGLGTGIQNLLSLVGIVKLTGLEFIAITDLAKSPAGTLTADKSGFVTGEAVQFQLALDRTTTDFLGVYNVKEVFLVRNSGGRREIARAVAGDGQTDFSFTFLSPDAGNSSEFFAFVVTRLLPFNPLSLELGNVAATSGATLVRARAGADAAATRCARGQNCEPGAGETVASDSQGAALRDSYSASSAGAGIGTQASSEASIGVPTDTGGKLSNIALACAGDASIVRGSGVDFANATGSAVVAFDVPPGTAMRYDFVAATPSLPVSNFAGSNVFIALIADPNGRVFPDPPAGSDTLFRMFTSSGDPRLEGARLLFGIEEGVTAYDGIPEEGSRSGTLEPGRYSLAMLCFSGGGTGSGTAAHAFQATLNLSR